jgi:hypothetical protein
VRIVATDTGFRVPAKLSAGLRHLAFENRGAKIHEGMLVKLPAGLTAAAYVESIRAGHLSPDGALDYSGIGLASPGERVDAWIRLDPGQYVVICWNGNHATTIPVHPFTVIADGAADDTPPKPDAVVRLVDFRFELQGALRSGTRTLRVETPGPSMHEMDIFRLRDGRSVKGMKRWRERGTPATRPARRKRRRRRWAACSTATTSSA